jgi:hypothetical protein
MHVCLEESVNHHCKITHLTGTKPNLFTIFRHFTDLLVSFRNRDSGVARIEISALAGNEKPE